MTGKSSRERNTQNSSPARAMFIVLICMAKVPATNCQVSLSLSRESASLCSSPIELKCSFHNVFYVRVEEFVTESMRFSLLTTVYISTHPDYEEEESAGLYKLRIDRVERYNGTQYRCHGLTEDLSQEFLSNVWTLVVPAETICAGLEWNTTDLVDTKNVTIRNNATEATSEQDPHPTEQVPTWNASLLSIIAVLPFAVLVLHMGAVLCAVVVRFRVQEKSASLKLHMEANDKGLQVSVQVDVDDHEPANSSPVLLARKPDLYSTLVVPRFEEVVADAAPVSVPVDLSDEPLQSTPVVSNDDTAGAIIGGEVVKYDNIGLQLNHTSLQSDVQQLLIRSRSDHGVEEFSMQVNPAYEALEVEDVPMQVNPAYETIKSVS